MICPRCADEKIEVMATSLSERGLDRVSVPALSLHLARYRAAAPHQPRTLSGSVPHDAERYR